MKNEEPVLASDSYWIGKIESIDGFMRGKLRG
jgi:hypothetical protein